MARARSVRSLLREVEGMPPGFARTALAEEAVRAADAANDLDAAFEARVELASAAEHGGEPQKALVAVTWCLAQIDAHPGRFDTHATYWALKWLPFTLLDIPDVPLDEVERVVGELRRRYESEGAGEDAVAKVAWTLPMATGRIEEAVAAHRRWRLVPRTEYGDCRACDVSSEVSLALAAGDPARAVDIARPVVAGRLDCAEEPARILAKLLEPLTELGQGEEAERLHQWGLRLARGNPSLVATQSEHVLHLVRTGRLDLALDLLIELVGVCDRGLFDVDTRMQVAAAGGSVAAALAASGRTTLERPLGDRPRESAELAAAFSSEAREIAAAFDRRNGTDFTMRKVDARLAIRPRTDVTAPAPSPPARLPDATPTGSAEPAGPAEAEDLGPSELLARARGAEALGDEARLALAEQALAGFEAAGDRAGAARARRSIGSALVRLERTDAGRTVLEDVVDELAGQPDEQVWAALNLADVAFEMAERIDDDARRWFDLALTSAERAPDRDLAVGRCRAAEAQCRVRELGPDAELADIDAAAAGFAEARELFAAHPEDLVQTWAVEAWTRTNAGDLGGGLRLGPVAWQMAVDLGEDETIAEVGRGYVQLLASTQDGERALEVAARVQEAELSLGDRAAAAQTALVRADLLREADRDEEALPFAWEAADLFAAAGERGEASWARLTAGRIFRILGQDASAYDILSEVLEQAAEDGDRRLEGAVALDLARLQGEYGDFDEGLASARRALDCLAEDDAGSRGRIHRTIADLYHARGELKEALAAGETAIAVLGEDEGEALVLAEVRQEHADRLVVTGRPDAALDFLAAARAEFTEHSLPIAVASVDLGRAEALAALGRTEEAVQLAQAAEAVGNAEEVPALVADARWSVATHSAPDAARYDRAIEAYREAGAPDEQLDMLRAQRDKALRPKSRWRR